MTNASLLYPTYLNESSPRGDEMSDSGFNTSFDAALLAASVLKRLDVGTLTSFDGRLKTQKVHYLGQVLGITTVYPFNLYIRGPYSPELSHDLFKLHESSAKITEQKFMADELEYKLKRLKGFVKEKSGRELELVVTLHWLLKRASLPLEKAIERLKTLKDATEAEIGLAQKHMRVFKIDVQAQRN